MRILKIISFSLIICLALCFSASAFSEGDISVSEAVGLGIKSADDGYVTRGNLAECIAEIIGFTAENADVAIIDVPGNHPCREAIYAVCSAGIMSCDAGGNFYPDEAISYIDFSVAMLRVAGYSDYADAMGGYPNGYIRLISNYKLTLSGVKLESKLTKNQADSILQKVLEMPFCNVTGVSEGNLIYDVSEDYTVLERYFSLVKKRGVVTSADECYVTGYSAYGQGTVGLTVGDDTSVYKSLVKNARQYLGTKVDFYLDEKNDTVVYMKKVYGSETLTLDYNSIEKISPDRTEISYRENGKTKKANLIYDLTIIYNGRNYSLLTDSDLHKQNVRLTLVNTDTDDAYEILHVTEYETVVVGGYYSVEKTVSDEFTEKKYSFSEDDFKNGVTFYYQGNIVDFRYIHIGDVLSVVTDKENTLREVYISDNVKEGKIQSLSVGDNTFSIDGNEYKPLFELSTSTITVRDNVRVYFDYFGDIVTYDKNPVPGGEYVYLIDLGRKSGLSKSAECKILNLSGEVAVIDLDTNFTVNGKRSDYQRLYDALMAGGRLHQLIFVTYSGDKIKNIDISNTPEGLPETDKYEKFTLNYQASSGSCMIYGTNINAQFITSQVTPSFYIALDKYGNVDEDEVVAGDYAQVNFVATLKPEIKIYDVNTARIPGAVVVYGVSGKIGEYLSSGRLRGTNVMVVEKIVHRLDEDGYYQEYLQGMILGMPKYMYPSEGKNFDDLKSGDIIEMGSYRGNELRSYNKVFTLSRDRKDTQSVLSPDGVYSEENPAYKNTQFTTKLSAGAIYGTVEEMGFSEKSTDVSYQNGVASKLSVVIRPEGTTDDDKLLTIPVTAQYNKDSAGTYIYVYDKATNTAYSILPGDIDLVGKKVYCYMYNALAKAIVVYE